MKKALVRFWPYLLSIFTGVGLFLVGSSFKEGYEDYKSLLQNISAAFIAIPLIYFIYELSKKSSRKKLTKELFNYAKMQVDRELLTIVRQLTKIVQPYDLHDFSFRGLNSFLSYTEVQISNMLSNSKYLGFQIFRHWSVSQQALESILDSPYILQSLDDDQIISLISILLEIRAFHFIQRQLNDIYEETGDISSDYKIKQGSELNKLNTDYPDRWILLKPIDQGRYVVSDFGDFNQYHCDKLLNIYKVSNQYLFKYAKLVSDFLKEINHWIEITGETILIDPLLYRIGILEEKEKAKGKTLAQ